MTATYLRGKTYLSSSEHDHVTETTLQQHCIRLGFECQRRNSHKKEKHFLKDTAPRGVVHGVAEGQCLTGWREPLSTYLPHCFVIDVKTAPQEWSSLLLCFLLEEYFLDAMCRIIFWIALHNNSQIIWNAFRIYWCFHIEVRLWGYRYMEFLPVILW